MLDGEEDVRSLPFVERRARLEAFVARLSTPRIDLSPFNPSRPGRRWPPCAWIRLKATPAFPRA